MTKSISWPESRIAFLCHSVPHSTLFRGSHSLQMGLLFSIWVTDQTNLWNAPWNGATLSESEAYSFVSSDPVREWVSWLQSPGLLFATFVSTRTEIRLLIASKISFKKGQPNWTQRATSWRETWISRPKWSRKGAAMQRMPWRRKSR